MPPGDNVITTESETEGQGGNNGAVVEFYEVSDGDPQQDSNGN